jgi:hypothetical protein
MAVHKIGVVCHEWDYQARKCATSVDVFQVDGTKACHFAAKLATDADGAPRAYAPGDKDSFDWLANIAVSQLHGIQGKDGVGPAPGFYVSGTAITDPAFKTKPNDTRCYVDASTIPYFALPRDLPVPAGSTLKDACVGYVVDSKTGGTTGAIFGDVGHAVGEASISTALRLGLWPISNKHPPKVIGFQSGADLARFIYIVFPGVAVPAPWPVATIQTTAENEFMNWGGETQLRALYPHLPPLKPPNTQAAPPPPTGAPLVS